MLGACMQTSTLYQGVRQCIKSRCICKDTAALRGIESFVPCSLNTPTSLVILAEKQPGALWVIKWHVLTWARSCLRFPSITVLRQPRAFDCLLSLWCSAACCVRPATLCAN